MDKLIETVIIGKSVRFIDVCCGKILDCGDGRWCDVESHSFAAILLEKNFNPRTLTPLLLLLLILLRVMKLAD